MLVETPPTTPAGDPDHPPVLATKWLPGHSACTVRGGELPAPAPAKI